MAYVIIPSYRPDQRLIEITDRLWEMGFRILVVDDGSGEAFQPIFKSLENTCIILRHSENQGKGAAIKTALSYLNGKRKPNAWIGIMDCDGQHLAEDMARLIDYGAYRERTLVLGVRSVGREMPLKSRLGNQITRTVFRVVSGVGVSDTQTGLRAFPSELAPAFASIEGERYEYEMNMLMYCAREGIRMEEVPIHTIYTDKKNSTSHFRGIRDSFRIYKDILKFTLSSFSSFLLDYFLFTLLVFLLPKTAACVLAANVTARILSAMYNYHMNCRFVFQTDGDTEKAAEYFVLAGVILLLNSLVLYGLTHGIGMPAYAAKIVTEFVLFCFSWLVQNYLIFCRRRGLY